MSTESKSMGLFARYLTLWVFLCIVTGIGLGALLPAIFHALGAMELAHFNIPVAILIWAMILPMLLGVMGRHGHRGTMEHLLIGSVTERVVRHAPCTVMVTMPHGILQQGILQQGENNDQN